MSAEAQAPVVQLPATSEALAEAARQQLDPGRWAWLDSGSGAELTRHDNESAFARLRLRNRVLADVRGGDTALELFGHRLAHPLLVAPIAFQRLLHRDGELATVAGASAVQAPMVVSTQASTRLEDIAAAAQTSLWFQLYLQHDRDFTIELVRRAEAADYGVLVLTIDAPVTMPRPRELQSGFLLPPEIEAVNLRGMKPVPVATTRAGGETVFASGLVAQAPRWPDLEWLCTQTRLPVVVKGVVDPDDARRAIAHGAAGIVVSNHGGRVLDGLPASTDALPVVARAVAGEVPLLLDGGIRRGTDVLKALALGAHAVLVGRPCMQALACAGAIGVAQLLHRLRTEFELAMVLTGCRDLAAIDRSLLWP